MIMMKFRCISAKCATCGKKLVNEQCVIQFEFAHRKSLFCDRECLNVVIERYMDLVEIEVVLNENKQH